MYPSLPISSILRGTLLGRWSTQDLGRRKPGFRYDHVEANLLCKRISDPQTDVAPGRTRGRNVRSKNQCSMCPAIHTKSRSWLRSSSTREPSDPLLRVVILVFFFARIIGISPFTTLRMRFCVRLSSPPFEGEDRR